jgi:hypothetical protein
LFETCGSGWQFVEKEESVDFQDLRGKVVHPVITLFEL